MFRSFGAASTESRLVKNVVGRAPVVSPTPKFRSKAFKTTLAGLKEIFDAHSMAIVVLDALERRVAEQILKRFGNAGPGARVQNLPRSELAGTIVSGFFGAEEVAFSIMKELDRACQKERHIVASIPEAHASDRIGSYRAIALKRERAKFVWALARDPRPSVQALANRVIAEFFAETADLETTRAVLEGMEDASTLQPMVLAQRLKEQADRLTEASTKMSDLESQLSRFEEERARLLAQMGAKERSLREQTEARGELEAQLAELKGRLSNLESEQVSALEAEAEKERAYARADDLAHKVRRLSKLAGVSGRLGELQSELEHERRRAAALEKELARIRQEHIAEREAFEDRVSRLESAHETTRADLKRARVRLFELEGRPVSPEPEAEVPEGSVILLDQANLAAAAAERFSRKVDFQALLEELAVGRTVLRAIAFVVDNGGAQFDAFCDTLRKAGWELRLKKPKTFSDGRSKADWDMGIAMEAVQLRGKADTVVLVSGDGDFAPLARLLRRWGLRVEVAAFADSLALELANAVDSVASLDTRTLE